MSRERNPKNVKDGLSDYDWFYHRDQCGYSGRCQNSRCEYEVCERYPPGWLQWGQLCLCLCLCLWCLCLACVVRAHTLAHGTGVNT